MPKIKIFLLRFEKRIIENKKTENLKLDLTSQLKLAYVMITILKSGRSDRTIIWYFWGPSITSSTFSEFFIILILFKFLWLITIHLYPFRARHANLFEVSVNVASGKAVNFTLTYQELLKRQHGLYEYELHIHPGQPVLDFKVEVDIKVCIIFRNSFNVRSTFYWRN